MEKSDARLASRVSPKSNVRAAASNAGPRLAEVAGKNMRNGMPTGSDIALGFLVGFEGADYGVCVGVQHYGRALLSFRQRLELGVRHAWHRERSAMEVDRVFGILEHMACENQHYRLGLGDESALHQLLKASQGHRRCWFAADA